MLCIFIFIYSGGNIWVIFLHERGVLIRMVYQWGEGEGNGRGRGGMVGRWGEWYVRMRQIDDKGRGNAN